MIHRWFAVDSGADHHFLCGEDNGAIIKRYTNKKLTLQVATQSSKPISVEIVQVTENSVRMAYAATHPRIRANLLSVSRMCKDGAHIIFDGNDPHIKMKDGAILHMVKKDGLYWVKLYFSKSATSNMATTKLLRQRMCHYWQTTCRVEKCEECMTNKAQKPSHAQVRSPKYNSKFTGEAVHFDHVGPLSVESITGCTWLLNCIDDYDGWVETYPANKKQDAVEGLKEYILQHGKPKSVRTDKDNVFAAPNSEWKLYCVRNGIILRHSAPYQPEQNGRQERFNRTIMDAVRCIMHGLDQKLWPYAAKCATYVWNRVDKRKKKSPYYVRHKREPSLDHLRRFGCECWIRIQNRKKLGPQYKRGIFLGYSQDSPSYIVGVAGANGQLCTLVSYDVKFNEEKLITDLSSIGVGILDDTKVARSRVAQNGGGAPVAMAQQVIKDNKKPNRYDNKNIRKRQNIDGASEENNDQKKQKIQIPTTELPDFILQMETYQNLRKK